MSTREDETTIRKGFGNFGVCHKPIPYSTFQNAHLGFNHITKQKFAVKIIEKTQQARERLEIAALRQLEHPNILSLHRACEDQDKCYLFLEYMEGGDLASYLEAKGPLKEKQARKFFEQLIDAVDECDRMHITTPSLAPESILLDETKQTVKLSDFSAIKRKTTELETEEEELGMSQEVKFLRGSNDRSFLNSVHHLQLQRLIREETDKSFQLGVLLFFMLYGWHPFQMNHSRKARKSLHRYSIGVQQATLSQSVRNLLSALLSKEPMRRPTIHQIREHPWLF